MRRTEIAIIDCILACATIERILACATRQRIVALATLKGVRNPIPGQPVISGTADNVFDIGYVVTFLNAMTRNLCNGNLITVECEINGIETLKFRVINCVAPLSAIERIITGAATKRIIAIIARNLIVGFVAKEKITKLRTLHIFNRDQHIALRITAQLLRAIKIHGNGFGGS